MVYKRHPQLVDQMAERVDPGRINMENQEYFAHLKKTWLDLKVDNKGNIVNMKKQNVVELCCSYLV